MWSPFPSHCSPARSPATHPAPANTLLLRRQTLAANSYQGPSAKTTNHLFVRGWPDNERTVSTAQSSVHVQTRGQSKPFHPTRQTSLTAHNGSCRLQRQIVASCSLIAIPFHLGAGSWETRDKPTQAEHHSSTGPGTRAVGRNPSPDPQPCPPAPASPCGAWCGAQTPHLTCLQHTAANSPRGRMHPARESFPGEVLGVTGVPLRKWIITLRRLLIPIGHGWVGSRMDRQPACLQLNAVAVVQHTAATSSLNKKLKSTTTS